MNHHFKNSKHIKVFSLITVLIVLVYLEYYAVHKERSYTLLKAGQRFPSIKVRTLSGNEESFDNRIRQRMVLIIFSTSCGHCVDEMRFWNQCASGIKDSIDVTAISADDPGSTAMFVHEHQVTFPVFTCAAKDVTDTLHVRSVPMVFFLDGEKILRRVIVGNQPKERVITMLHEFLIQKGPGAN